jgi:photosystem II stability/assembly factor-like uncharacterized protein
MWIGTSSGIHVLRDGALEPHGCEGQDVTAVHAAGDTVLAGSYENGMYRSEDGGGSWSRVEAGLTASTIRCLEPERGGGLLAGTEPARIFRSTDGGASWSELDGITRIEGHERWYLPYSPRAGAVRNVLVAPQRLLASVEVGGLLASDDGGASWTIAPVVSDDDIHFVAGHPDDPDVVYAALGWASLSRSYGARLGGIARSRDGGASWEKLETDYTRAVLVPPARPDLLLAAPALSVGRGGRIVVSADDGESWAPASGNVETPMPDMVERFAAGPDGDVWAICSGGRLLRATPGEWRWESMLPEAVRARAIAF